ncbi:uncharacterized protein LOC119607565 isoform X1 [Lucilia sericata]|uniref:uncharacterized protein LOC119607565 isoform X1 n=1 Tax=Lucilia sericata TaxID=13632 RepID=UPI0018A87F11|nr:uncharacterized protein LOC119607565 isoform X1 [Lucilia sericata]
MCIKMEKKSKRNRGVNWIEEDKILLKRLVKERIKAIEDKNTDTDTNQRKKLAWLEIEEKFNSKCLGGPRNVLQLKSQWTLTKVQAKKDLENPRKPQKIPVFIDTAPPVKQIVKPSSVDVQYREELHLLQMENERKKARNLDLEYELLQEKIKFYRRNPDDNNHKWNMEWNGNA